MSDGSVGTWCMTRTSDDYTEAVLLMPDGSRRRCCVQRVRLDTPEEARRVWNSEFTLN